MNTPGFGAEYAIYRSSQRYSLSRGMFGEPPGVGELIMAIPIGGGNPHRECLDDCRDTCTDAGNSVETCRTKCGRLCRGGPGLPSPAPNPVNQAICVGG